MKDQSKVRDTAELPTSYVRHITIDFKKDRKFAAAVQGIFVLVVLLALGAALVLDVPAATSWGPAVTIPVTLAACLIYMAVHEVTHGIVLQLLTKVKPSYAVRFPFLTTGNHAFLTRRSAVLVALAPSVFWGIVLGLGLLTLPQDYLLSAYILLTLNFAGSAGDFLETYVVTRQQQDVLIKDDGKLIHVFIPETRN
ncbi:DUF3267 domain-containing protein [Arthrobacter flavus]|uniref:DUF3267 domain-containing protein n=1 Tax=Arthrobacter flavus TaxID=95172 RepID=A0ABW4QC01_9MICC